MKTPLDAQPEAIAYDYEHQAWVVNGRYARCAHPPAMDCQCYGKTHEGEILGDDAQLH